MPEGWPGARLHGQQRSGEACCRRLARNATAPQLLCGLTHSLTTADSRLQCPTRALVAAWRRRAVSRRRIRKGKYPASMILEVRTQRMATVHAVGEWRGKCALRNDSVTRTDLFLMLQSPLWTISGVSPCCSCQNRYTGWWDTCMAAASCLSPRA